MLQIKPRGRPQLFSDDSYANIYKWINNPTAPELTQKDKDFYDRLVFAYEQLRIESKSNTVARLIKRYSLSQSQAYKDINNAIALFNPIYLQDKEFVKVFLIENIMRNIRRLDMADNDRPYKFKMLDRLYSQLYKVAGLDQNNEKIDPEMLGGNKFYAQFIFNNTEQQVFVDFDNKKAVPEKTQKELIEFSYENIDINQATEFLETKEDGNETTIN